MGKILEKQLAEVFEQDYQGYEYFVENVINKVFTGDDTYEALPVPENILDDTNRKVANNAGILQILKIGSIDAIEGIDVYDITLRDNKQLQYNRVGIQQLIRSQQIFYSNILKKKSGAFRSSINRGRTKTPPLPSVSPICLAKSIVPVQLLSVLHYCQKRKKTLIICLMLSL